MSGNLAPLPARSKSTDAEKAKWNARRAPRLTVEEKHVRAVQRRDRKRHVEKLSLEMTKATKAGDAERRAKAKAKRRAAYELGLLKTHELGAPPVYRGHGRDSYGQREWAKRAKAWDIAHQPRPEREAA